jgi:hypothetical protein
MMAVLEPGQAGGWPGSSVIQGSLAWGSGQQFSLRGLARNSSLAGATNQSNIRRFFEHLNQVTDYRWKGKLLKRGFGGCRAEV